MSKTDKKATVVIVGGGIAGLALGNFLLRKGISCIILERHGREYVEQRQRAGALDAGGVRRLREWGLAEVVEGRSRGDLDSGVPLLIEGERRQWRREDDSEDVDGVFCPQQILVQNLIKVFLRDGGDLRFGAEDVSLHDIDTEHPLVRYRDATGSTKTVSCDFIAGSDGFRGVSRTAVPDDVLTCSAHEFGYAWLTVMTEVPADPPAVLAVHSRGFAAQITRGPSASRLYLQCPLTDTIEQWPDDRIWHELDARFGEPVTPKGPITSKQVVPLRGVVFSPMSYGTLYLLGDAAHLISPMSAEGMSLALHDADVFARAVVQQVENHDSGLLESYSDTCLDHTWQRQAAAVWLTETMHDSGDPSYEGEFRRQIARKNLANMLERPGAGTLPLRAVDPLPQSPEPAAVSTR
ncbi:4-hydroxybenzoate 3-monooxygenase [Streptomyces sp. RPA4-5]|uniref:4-hydroxybenzoate 3-monooxygenase n=1 Tax=unclassified Streptomyces TaxID=2593676 RepID=UPI00143E18B7|nr:MULTISPECIES: 4-hydroxybenzoate 3-monooxygenase [unclassified Streptomyces]QIY54113.1 4-hydroxybenzoate 3-monooxygenase [Streptomyces sp. RPA4-5]WJY36697.1 4-hydroxybenzoate 3-monooxygenase [Streptomyces sp. P9-2B-2]